MSDNKTGRLRQQYTEASKKVEGIRDFYSHIAVYIPVSILMIISAPFAVDYLEARGLTDPEALRWVRLNFYIIPLIWLVVLMVHGVVAYWYRLGPRIEGYKPGFLKRWEARQIRRFLDDASNESKE